MFYVTKLDFGSLSSYWATLLCTEEITTGLIHAIRNKVRIKASESHVYWKDSEKFLLCLRKRYLEIDTLGDKIPLYVL